MKCMCGYDSERHGAFLGCVCLPNAVPRYTHPSKDLSDEETILLWNEIADKDLNLQQGVLAFRDALLKKASEK